LLNKTVICRNSINVNIFKINLSSLSLALKYPPFAVRVRNGNNETSIFDPIRKKWFILTPEEWVRQHLLNYLVTEKKYPASIIAIEKEIVLNDLKKRFDVVIYNKQKEPALLIECKAPYIELDNNVIEQIQRYNLTLKAPYLMITNGVSDMTFNQNNNIIELPDYENF
jgi:hypothetical protein